MRRTIQKIKCSIGLHIFVLKFILGEGPLKHVYSKKYICGFCGKEKIK